MVHLFHPMYESFIYNKLHCALKVLGGMGTEAYILSIG